MGVVRSFTRSSYLRGRSVHGAPSVLTYRRAVVVSRTICSNKLRKKFDKRHKPSNYVTSLNYCIVKKEKKKIRVEAC